MFWFGGGERERAWGLFQLGVKQEKKLLNLKVKHKAYIKIQQKQILA